MAKKTRYMKERIDACIIGALMGETDIQVSERLGITTKTIGRIKKSEVYEKRLEFAKEILVSILGFSITEGLPHPSIDHAPIHNVRMDCEGEVEKL